ncbi:phytoene desaturase family protein [Demequina aurantiaca]|uniref:phytoene desaturase family protein n=1 Tax=Demequina aurantiaca TaxID=676200 RepID=UPI003D33D962
MPSKPLRVVVIGGGIGGLATAALLARGGAEVTLVEQNAQLGGRAGRLEVDGFTFDTGPSWYLMPEAFTQFYALMGRDVNQELDLIDLDPRYRVYFEGDSETAPGEQVDVSADADANYALFNSLSPGDGDAMREYAAESKELYDLALERFLYTTFERPTAVASTAVTRSLPKLSRLLTRSLGAKVASSVKDARLRQILGFHAVFLGSSPSRAPSLFSLMSHLDLTDGVRYPRGGMYALIESIEKMAIAEGVQVRTSTRARRILVEPNGIASGVSLEGGEVLAADIVVSGADMHHTETELIAPAHQWQPEAKWSGRQPGISALLVMAGVEGPLPELEHHTLFFTKDWDANFEQIVGKGELTPPFPASIYAARVSATNPDAAPAGHENLVLLVPFPADPTLGATERSREDLHEAAAAYLQQVADWAGVPDLVERTTIYNVTTPSDFATELNAWRGSALGLEHTLRQSAMFRPANVSSTIPNLLYTGSSTTPGIGLPMCLISAELVAKRLLGATGVEPLQTPAPVGFLRRSRRRDVLGTIVRQGNLPSVVREQESESEPPSAPSSSSRGGLRWRRAGRQK